MYRIIFTFLLLFIINSTDVFSQSADFPTHKYTIKIPEEDLRLVDIKASFLVKDAYLEMDKYGIPESIREGWAKFVTIKSISDINGHPVSYVWNDSLRKWKLNINANSAIKLHYQVQLKHDDYNWDAAGGMDGRPTIMPGSTIFWVTKGLFIISSGADEYQKTEVIFDVPAGFKVSTAWTKLSDKKFIASDIYALTSNLLVIGKHLETTFSLDSMSIRLVMPDNMKHRSELLTKTMEKILPAYKNIFGELPSTNYLICTSLSNDIEDGEAYANSFHQMFLDKDLGYRQMVWANTFAHEMFHYWTGVIYDTEYEGSYWFTEGFTDYYSSLTLVRTGIVSEVDFLTRLAFQFSRYYTSQRYMKEKISLVKAGSQKIENWHLIYGGGATMAFILDVEIRAATKGMRSLDDFMRILYLKYAKKQTPINQQIIIAELNNLTKTDFTNMFKKYISGTEPALEVISSACEKAGLALGFYQSEFYLKPKKEKAATIYHQLIKSVKN